MIMGKLNFLWISLKLALGTRDFSVFRFGIAYCIGGLSMEEYQKKMEERKKIWLDKQTEM